MKQFFFLLTLVLVTSATAGQQVRLWTEKDRHFLLDNLERTKNELIKATENLTQEQWAFKPAPGSWSIAQVLEHLGIFERIFDQEAEVVSQSDPEPEVLKTVWKDSTYIAWMAELVPHVSEKNSIPLGFMKGKDNLTFFLFGRDVIIDFIKTTNSDLRYHFVFRASKEKRRSVHALMLVHYGHSERHLRQIARIKASSGYPK